MCDKSTHVLPLMQITSLEVSADHLALSSILHFIGFPKHKDVDKQDFWVRGRSSEFSRIWGGVRESGFYKKVVFPLTMVSKK